MNPRRTLQLSLVIAAIVALAIALTGAFSPVSADPGTYSDTSAGLPTAVSAG